MTDAGGAESYIDFLEREFSGEIPAAPEDGMSWVPPAAEQLDWHGLQRSLSPRSRFGPLFGVTQRDIDRAWKKLSIDPDLLVPRQPIAKRVIDVLAAGTALVVLLPLVVALAAVIRSASPGPALFRQLRIGAGGRPFTMYSFRTMHVSADTMLATLADGAGTDGILFKLRSDPRVTPIGRFLRRYSLDELPQLFNVLRGDMSLVGPRPALPMEVARYDGVARRRLLVKPGLTGLWQVSGRGDLTWHEAVRLDLRYVDNAGLALDLAILVRTVRTILSGRRDY